MSSRLLTLLVVCAVGGLCWLLADEVWDPAASRQDDVALTGQAGRGGGLGTDGPVLTVVPGGRPALVEGSQEGDRPATASRVPPAEIGARFRGTVRGPRGAPMGNVRVFLEGPGGRFDLTTDAQGRFDRSVPLGRYAATFLGADGGALYMPSLVLDASTGVGAGFSATLGPTVALEVLVLRPQAPPEGSKEKTTWIPAVEASVEVLHPYAARLSQETTTGGEGLALFEGLLSEPHHLVVRLSEDDATRYRAELTPGALPRLVVQMPERSLLQGKVTAGVEGPGIDGAAITLRHGAEAKDGVFETTFASAYGGTFKVLVPRAKAQSVLVRAGGFMQWPATPLARRAALRVLGLVGGSRAKPLHIVLKPGILVRGSLHPPEGVTLPPEGLAFVLVSRTDVRIPGRSDPTGAFEVAGLSTGRWRMELEAPGWLASTFGLTLRASMGPVHDMLGVLLRRAGGASGRVLDAGGQPVAGARVTYFLLQPGPNREWGPLWADEAFTDSLGGWSMPDLFTPFQGFLRATRGTQISRLVAMPANARRPVDLALLPAGRVSGRLLDAESGEGVPGVTLRFSSLQADTLWSGREQTDASGAFSLPPLLPGAWRLAFEATGYLAGTPLKIDVTVEKPVVLVLELDPGVVFAGQCVDEQGTPLPGTKIHVSGTATNSWAIRRTVNVDAAGRFRVGGLPEGTYAVRALLSGYQPLTKSHLSQADDGMKLVLRSK